MIKLEYFEMNYRDLEAIIGSLDIHGEAGDIDMQKIESSLRGLGETGKDEFRRRMISFLPLSSSEVYL